MPCLLSSGPASHFLRHFPGARDTMSWFRPTFFDSEICEERLDKTFAVMALCPQHSFRLVSAFPQRFRNYVCKITADRDAWLMWRLEASFVLGSLGRSHEAKGHGPV